VCAVPPFTARLEVLTLAQASVALGGLQAPKAIGAPGVPSIVNVTLPVGAVEPEEAWTLAVKVIDEP
jgi:hypothetical protein